MLKKIIVIGGSGFIGTRLCQRLFNHNFDFQILDKVTSRQFSSKTLKLDIVYPLEIDSILDANILINLAAEHRDDVTPVTLYDEVNVVGAKNVCDHARAKNISKIIFTSSVAIYGFAPLGTNESGVINPFNDYGRTKWEAELVYKEWQSEDPQKRTLVIIRPTVVFGEGNRGNVYNLLKQIASGKFLIVGKGLNRKSIAYVENVAAFIEYSLNFNPGVHIYNYVDKPDLTMNNLVAQVNKLLGKSAEIKFRLPVSLGLLIGSSFDIIAKLTGKKFPISSIRVKKFCIDSVYDSAVESTGFVPDISLVEAIERTIKYEFYDNKVE